MGTGSCIRGMGSMKALGCQALTLHAYQPEVWAVCRRWDVKLWCLYTGRRVVNFISTDVVKAGVRFQSQAERRSRSTRALAHVLGAQTMAEPGSRCAIIHFIAHQPRSPYGTRSNRGPGGGGSFLPRRSIRSTYGSIRPTGALARKAEIGQTLTGLAQKYHVAVPAVCRQGAL